MADAPVTSDFLADVAEEAGYQRAHWGEDHDAEKGDPYWFWTLGHIVGKAIHDENQTVEKQRHRLRAGAALLLNWDRHIAAREADATARVATTFEDGTTVSVRREPPQSASVPTISDAARLVAEGEPNLALAALDQRREAADAASANEEDA